MRDLPQTFGAFFRRNFTWLAGGVLLTFCSSVGQTFFISLFAGQIRSDFDMSHGEFGFLYMLATLGSAITLIWLGKIVDHIEVTRLAKFLILALAGAAFLISIAQNWLVLLVAIYLLRLFGQGMLTHTALVAMGRWFHAERGRAVAITTTGHQLGEGLLPILMVSLLVLVNWRIAWLLAAVGLLLLALPLSHKLLAVARTPTSAEREQSERGKQWTRAEVLKDVPFWMVCTGVLAPAFIGTSVFFHQVHLAQIKLWAPTVVASSFVVMSVTSIGVGLLVGQLIDRFSARIMLPLFLCPLGIGCASLGYFDTPWSMQVFMFFLGASYGISSAVFGSIWPEIYGTRHLGSIRAIVSAAMVFASALGPGITGWFIDRGIGFERQLFFMSAYCLLMMLILFPISRVLAGRAQPVIVSSSNG